MFDQRCVALNRWPLVEQLSDTADVSTQFVHKRKIDTVIVDLMARNDAEVVIIFAVTFITDIDNSVHVDGENVSLLILNF